jgi:NDP-sugar pyrophosphorylase family protein
MKIDLGRLTQEETAELLREAINLLPTDTVIQTICDVITSDDREELIASLESKRS